MIELAFHKDGVYALGDGSSIEVVAGEVVQVGERCPAAHEETFASVLSRNAAPWRKPSERTAVRFITRAALTKRHTPLVEAGIDPGVLALDDREMLIPTVTREEWEAKRAAEIAAAAPPELVETDEAKSQREAAEAEAKRLAGEAAALGDQVPADGASSETVRKAGKGKGSAG